MAITAASSPPSLRDAVMAAAAVSFGFHGTLFHRTVATPGAVFDILGRRFGLPKFAQQRAAAGVDARDRMRLAGRREVTLADIYDALPIESALARAVMAAEIALELDLLRPDAEASDAFRHAHARGLPVLVVADTHLGRTFVREALSRHGLPSAAVFVSSDCNLTAAGSGDLFDLAIDYLDTPRDRVLHIGGDLAGDVAQARAKGLMVLHHSASSGDEDDIARVVPLPPPDTLSARDLGYHVAGPAAVGFLNWIERRVRKDGIGHVLFPVAAGHLLDRALKNYPGLWALPGHSLIPGSEVAFRLAAMDDQNFREHLPFLISGSNGLRPFEVLERIGVPAPAPEIMARYGLGDESRLSPALHSRLRGFLFEYRFEILKVCRRNRRALLSHLRHLGLEPGRCVALVDLSWDGAVQESFEAALRGLVTLSLQGYSFFGPAEGGPAEGGPAEGGEGPQRLSPQQRSAFFDADNVAPAIVRRLQSNRSLVRLLFSPLQNAIIGLEPTPDGARGLQDERWDAEGDHAQATAALMDGAMAFIGDHAAALAQGRAPAPALETAWPLVDLLNRPVPLSDALRPLANLDPWTDSARRAG
ncbi:hypothetical protein [Nitrospirillum sp. BR 11828]|uniref:hypothetical protein n=1 Tax=Nitrospirillum sp. BR 11828 TaxID=3104325 RepID=UPI002ACA87E1|nr:hypothetical protein [Nitrospirillum sp. BR 11828]MDZ5650715.1 hypothetical protein [Nitrospirillum sp. BR 11828]